MAWPPPQNVPNSNSNAGRPGAFLAPFLKYCKGRTHKKEDKNGIGFLLRLGAQPDLLETRLAKFSFCEVVATLAVQLPANTRKILCQNGQASFLQLQNCCHVTKVVRRQVRCKHTRWRDMGCFMHVKDTPFFFRCSRSSSWPSRSEDLLLVERRCNNCNKPRYQYIQVEDIGSHCPNGVRKTLDHINPCPPSSDGLQNRFNKVESLSVLSNLSEKTH